MKSSTPRLSGRTLRIAAKVIGSGAGAAIRRYLGAQLVDHKLAGVDLTGQAPLYMPRSWRQ